MQSELEQLKQLVLEGGYDSESREYVESLQARIQRTIAAERLLEHPVIVELIAFLEAQEKGCTQLLSNDRKLSELERQTLFEKRDILRSLLAFFKPNDKLKLEEEIKSLLNVRPGHKHVTSMLLTS